MALCFKAECSITRHVPPIPSMFSPEYTRILLSTIHQSLFSYHKQTGLNTIGRNGVGRQNIRRGLVHGAGKSSGGLPLGRCSRCCLFHHLVDLLERQALGLGHKEVSVNKRAGAETTPYEKDRRLHVAFVLSYHVRRDDGNNGVPEPVGSSREANATGTNGQREDLADDDPGAGAPGRGKPKDVNGNEGNLGVDGGSVVGKRSILVICGGSGVCFVESDRNADNGDDELAEEHASSAPKEDGAAAKSLHSPERQRCRQDVDEGEDERHEERVLDSTRRLKEGRRVIENEIDTGPLLHHLKRRAQDGSAKVRLGLPETALEAVGPATDEGRRGNERALIFLIGDNLGQLGFDVVGILGLTTKARECIGSPVEVAPLDEVAGRVGE